jgi:murein DD-endopeptidase MepM/ murein hydrolase activator NlpD
MLTLYLLQSVLPLVLIAWLGFVPPRNVAGFWIQAVAIVVVLVAISRVGIMSFPPWWMLYLFGALLVVAVASGVIRRRGMTRWPFRLADWLCLAGFAAIGLYAANMTRVALAAAATPKGRIVDLASPLEPGTYLVANGGAAPEVNAHAALLDQTIPAHRRYWATAHGVDLVALDRWGFRADGLMPADPRRYVIFGRLVIAPCAGQVIAVLDGLPDMQVPQVDRAHLAGNHVILRCADADILLGHFRKDSVRVRIDQQLAVGDAIAKVGNSGNTSEPHLHINAQLPGTVALPFAGAPIPIRIGRRYLVRNDRFVSLDHAMREAGR